tara:strand:- start:1673 stop:3178 length:1506 start_codon:yes stop_codon:yes gene_type:complete
MKSKKNVMLIEFSDHVTNHIFKEMQNFINIHTCISNKPDIYSKKNFPNTVVFHNHECLNGRNLKVDKIKNYFDTLSLLEREILIFLIKRQNINYIDKDNIKKFVNYLFSGWSHYIKENKIDFLIFYLNPHLVYSYVIYIIAKRKKLKVKILENNKYLNLYYFIDKIENYPIKLKNLSNSNKIIPKHIKNYINQFRNRKKIPPHSIGEDNNFGEYLRIAYRTFVRVFFKEEKILEYFFKKQKNSFFNYTNFFPTNIKSRHSKFKDNFLYFKVYNISNKLKKNYEGNSISIDKLNKQTKYIFFSANFQPEKTTCPDGLNYFNQLEVLKILNNFCNKNKSFKILYKEHPAQFYYKKFGFLVKNEDFYKKLFKLKNIIFLSLETNIVDVIKLSKITTTVTGEAGLQSLLLGKPSVVFGYPWYKNFKYIVSINKNKDFNKNLIKRLEKSKISEKKIYQEFYKLIDSETIRLIFDNKSWELKNIKNSYKMKKYLNKNFIFFKKNLVR